MLPPSWSWSLSRITTMNANNHYENRNQTILFPASVWLHCYQWGKMKMAVPWFFSDVGSHRTGSIPHGTPIRFNRIRSERLKGKLYLLWANLGGECVFPIKSLSSHKIKTSQTSKPELYIIILWMFLSLDCTLLSSPLQCVYVFCKMLFSCQYGNN